MCASRAPPPRQEARGGHKQDVATRLVGEELSVVLVHADQVTERVTGVADRFANADLRTLIKRQRVEVRLSLRFECRLVGSRRGGHPFVPSL